MDKITLSNVSHFTIYYEDTDFSGFVYHANYLKFFERSREHLLGIKLLKSLYASGLHFVVTSAALKYKAPARFGDQIVVQSEGSFSRSPRIKIMQKALSIDGMLLVDGIIEVALVNAKNAPERLSKGLLEVLSQQNSQNCSPNL